MKVRIVHYELGRPSWILEKFAFKLHKHLQELGIESDVDAKPDENADINHHIIYYDFDCVKRGIDTLMITHIDTNEKLERLKKQMMVAEAGICMSKETADSLAQLNVKKNGLCYIDPAHDGVMSIRKIVIGFSYRVYADGRKREGFINKLADKIDPRFFKFKIMGENWDLQVEYLTKKGFEVDYIDHFDGEQYLQFIPSLDYYLYMGMDEGQMGFIDALAAGVKTIVTAQGYHLDAIGGITHPFTTYEELEQIFLALQKEKQTLVESVQTWNWLDYTRKHVEIWQYLLDNKLSKSNYMDGLNSLLYSRNNEVIIDKKFAAAKTKELKNGQFMQLYYKNKRQFTESYRAKGVKGIVSLIAKKIAYRLK